MSTKTAATIHQEIADAGVSPDRDIRYVRSGAVGQNCRQGDVYLLRVAKRPECYATKSSNRQLAPGTSKGSRHILDGAVTVFTAPEAASRDAVSRLPGVSGGRLLLPGPCVEADERFTLTHPEHAHHSLPAGCYVTVYQLDQRSMRRVQD